MEIVSSVAQMALPLQDRSQVGEARRAARIIAEQLSFSDEQGGKLAIIVTEAATNLAIHAKQGELLLCPNVQEHGGNFVDVITVDRGPGISDVTLSLNDGYSTAGTPGNGLGAIQRLADKFEVYSQNSIGTVMLARVRAGDQRHSAPTRCLQPGFICLPVKGEMVSGDSVGIRVGVDNGSFMVADGLGHGVAANEASLEAAKIFSEEKTSTPTQVLDSMNHGLRSTRGAAIAVGIIDCQTRTVRYSGVGNIAGAIFKGDASRSLISHNGIIGHQLPRLQEFTYDWPTGGVLVMNSDGLVTNWRLNTYPGLLQKDPTLIAAVLYRDFSRGRDDVSILVVKESDDA